MGGFPEFWRRKYCLALFINWSKGIGAGKKKKKSLVKNQTEKIHFKQTSTVYSETGYND